MQKPMLVAVLVGCFTRTGGESVVSNINILIGSSPFPDAGWSDFPVTILTWWIDALDRAGRSSSAELSFMDGPYIVRVSPTSDPELVRVAGVNQGGPPDVPEPEVIASRAQLHDAMVDAARATLAVCDARGWGGGDVAALRQALRGRPRDSASLS